MRQKIGHLLENSNDFFNWINSSATAMIALHASVRTGLIDAVNEEPQTIERLAKKLSVPAEQLSRLVTFLAAHEIIDLLPDGRVGANAHTEQLQDAGPCVECTVTGTIAGAQLDRALRNGSTAYETCFGLPVFQHLSENPELGGVFNDFMGFMTRRQAQFIFDNHSFGEFGTVADVGGSQGDFLLAVLDRYPAARGILFDLPEVTGRAAPLIAASRLADKIDIISGSFFEAVPAADLYTLKMILHDWSDEECIAILGAIRTAINPGGRVAVIDQLMAEVPTPGEALDMDIAMFVWDTGRERKRSEFESLFEAAGFKLSRVTENHSGVSVMEAVPV